MNRSVPFTLAVALLVSACGVTPGVETGDQALEASTASPVLRYQCESGEVLNARYPSSDVAVVQYKGRTHEMAIAVSASGARYVGDGLEWWTKGSGPGSEGVLSRLGASGASGAMIDVCSGS